MRNALIALGSTCFIIAITACTGGPGSLPDPNGGQSAQGVGSSGDQGSSGDEGSSGGTSGVVTTSSGGSTTSTSSSSTTGGPSASTYILLSSYNTTCTSDTDCIAIFTGNVCSGCRCPNAAINKSDSSKYSSDVSKGVSACGGNTGAACDCAVTQPPGCDPDLHRCGLGVTSSTNDAGAP